MTQTLTQKRASQVDTIDSMLRRIGTAQQSKTAAEANTEAGGYQGETTHPVKNVDDRTDDAQEGARSAENTADVKDEQGSPSVDSTSPGTPGGQDSVQMNIGTQQSATGEDSPVETSSAKGGKDDPGTQRGETSHPARTDNDSLDGHKYASQAAKVLGLIKSAQDRGTALIARIASESNADTQKRAQAVAAKQAAQKAAEPTAAGDPGGNSATPDSEPDAAHPPGKGKKEDCGKCAEDNSAQAGYDLAGAVAAGGMVEGAQKRAQDEMIVQSLEETIKQAYALADKTASYLDAYDAEKRAMGEASDNGGATDEPADQGEGGDEGSGGGGGDPPAEGAGPEGPPEALGGGGGEEDALLDLLAQGEDMGGEEALGGMAGGAPPMGGGAPPMGGAPGMEGGGQLGEEELAMLAAALQQAGITPEAFEAAASAKAAAALQKQGGTKAAWKPKTAAEAQAFQRMVNYVKEVTG